LIRTITADRSGTSDDQTTIYAYGTKRSDGHEIVTGHLLYRITYPDHTTSEPGIVTMKYESHRKVKEVIDQAGNHINFEYDQHGRETARRTDNEQTGYDTAVKAIETSYTALGNIDVVTQRDGSNAILDQVKFTYDGLDKMVQFDQDVDSAIGASGIPTRSIQYSYELATGGRNTIRRHDMTYPDGSKIDYEYFSSGGSHDDDASRVSQVKFDSTGLAIVGYEYLGDNEVVGTDVFQPSAYRRQYGTGTGNYDKLDRFGRVTSDIWTRKLSSNPAVKFYETPISYDENSNPTLVDDKVHSTNFDVQYTLDKLNRLQRAKEGDWNGTGFNSNSRDEQWDLGSTGNWIVHQLDRNGDGVFTGTGDLNENNPDTGSGSIFNKTNEQNGRDVNNDSTIDYTLVHDATGNLTDDGKDFTYKFDIWGRLREVHAKTSGSPLVAEYRYNGLGYLIAEHKDVTDSGGGDPDGTVNSDDPWYFRYYDEEWKAVMTYRSTDSNPKERFVFHSAGADGFGTASYGDDQIVRDIDLSNGWAGAADGTMEIRRCLFQNRRHDMVAILDDGGSQVEQDRYSAYGRPFNLHAGDMDSNGYINSNDGLQLLNWYAASTYDVRGDLNLNGSIDANDFSQMMNVFALSYVSGQDTLSQADVQNRSGYAGYQWDSVIGCYHVRYRVYSPEIGRWLTRDPIEYESGSLNQYQYTHADPEFFVDPWGLQEQAPTGSQPNGSDPSKAPPPKKKVVPKITIDFHNKNKHKPKSWKEAADQAAAQCGGCKTHEVVLGGEGAPGKIDPANTNGEDDGPVIDPIINPSTLKDIQRLRNNPNLKHPKKQKILALDDALQRIISSLDGGGILTIACCSAGAGQAGDDLLKEFKDTYPGRYVIRAPECPIDMKPGGGPITKIMPAGTPQELWEPPPWKIYRDPPPKGPQGPPWE